MKKSLGKITLATFGYGGYQDAQVGLSLTFEGKDWGVGHFVGTWAHRSEHAEYSVEEWDKKKAEAVDKLRETLKAAGKKHIGELVGVPVDCVFTHGHAGGSLVSWRVLTEVL